MGKGRKKYSYQVKGRSSRLQYARARASHNEESNEDSEPDACVDNTSKAAQLEVENSEEISDGLKESNSEESAYQSHSVEKISEEQKSFVETKFFKEEQIVNHSLNGSSGKIPDSSSGMKSIQITSSSTRACSNLGLLPNESMDEFNQNKELLSNSGANTVPNQTLDKNKQRNSQRIFSDDKKEFVKQEKKSNGVQYSGRIRLIVSDSFIQLTFGYFGSKNLLVIDSEMYDTFVGNITITDGEELNFNESFTHNKNIIFERIAIAEILVDELLSRRNEAHRSFRQTLKNRSKSISDDISCTEDFLQFLLIGRSQNLSSDKPLILLENIIKNECISDKVKEDAKRLEVAESLLFSRNQFFPKFDKTANPDIPDLFAEVRNICQEGVKNHKRNLLNRCPNNSFHLVCLVATINHLPSRNLLYISIKDIELFSNIMELTYEKDHNGENIFPVNIVEYLWNNFYKKIEVEKSRTLKKIGPMTHPIYYFLLKTLRDVIADICSKEQIETKELISSRDGELTIAESIPCTSETPVNKSLEERFRLLFRLMKHFEPGAYSFQNKFKYIFKLLKENENASLWQTLKNMIWGSVSEFDSVSQERIVWLYIVDCGVAPILGDKSKTRFKQISLSVLTGFVKFIQEAKHDRYESFRVAAHDIIKFAAQISPYFSAVNSILTNVDHNILNKQIDIISQLLSPNDNDIDSGHFSDLMMIYNEYWEHRESIVGKLPIPCSIFKPDVEIIMEKLIQIVQKALLRDFKPQLTIKFLRLYNEFLKHLQGIDFTWFISKNSFFPGLDKVVEKITKNDIISYKVTEPEDFFEILKKNRRICPKHFSIEVVKKLLDIIGMSFEKVGWNDEDCVKAAGDLFLAVGHSFTHFEDQTDYTDLEHFLRDCTVPFCCVIENSTTYSEFKQRLDNVENFYLYSRKQNQIGIQQALDLCERDVQEAEKNEFKTNIDRNVLEECYNRYSKKLVFLENLEIVDILNDIENELKIYKNWTLDKWTIDFKRNFLPGLLANLAAVWSLKESKDVVGIKKRIEPHCVQILCILRLLGVDQSSDGIPKHFAQVLTGQGKSLILSLLAVIIALTGNVAFIVCYSSYLAERDKTSFVPFFNTFDRFGVKNKISYNTFDDMANNTLAREVDGSEKSLRSVVSDLVLNKLQKQSMETLKVPKNTVLLIDEADVFFSDIFYGKLYHPCTRVGIPALLKIQPKIWSIIQDGVSDKITVLRKIREYINDLVKDEDYDDFRKFLKDTTNFFEKNLERMVADALLVSNISDEYIIDKLGSLAVEDSSFIYASNTISSYLNTFYYFRLKRDNYRDIYYLNFGYLLVGLGSISYASLPLRYENILGVSGTLIALSSSEINAVKNYGIHTMSAMPSFFGDRKLIFEPSENVSIFETETNWQDNIFEKISEMIRQNRAVLVFFQTDKKMKLFAEKYRNKVNRLYTLSGNEPPATLEWRINEAGVSQTVTLATRTMGRGVDYKSNDRSVEENGGVHVIQTFFSLDEKEETQIKGRTARKDNKGSYELILCREHLNNINCSKTEAGRPINTYEELLEAREKIAKKKGALVEENIRKSDKKHNMTMQFFESLSNYSPEKRHEYFSKFPFVDDE